MNQILHPKCASFIPTPMVGICLFVLLMGGCGGSGFPVAPISGMVTLDDKPLANAHVSFEPVGSGPNNLAGPGSFGTTDESGRFHLQTLDKQNGAVVGEHRVTIRTFRVERGENDEMAIIQKEILPARYHSKSELLFEVPSNGTDQANFKLVSE